VSKLFLPERHPVRDFFVLDVMDVVPRSDMASMAHPIFSLATKPDTRILRYTHDNVVVEIHPSSKGLATIFDKDVLIYCISKLMHLKNQGEEIGPIVRITTHDLLVSTNRNTGGIIYQRLEDALDRLAGTRIKTNIATGEEVSTQNFGLIEWYDYNRKGSGMSERLKYLDLKLSDWMFRAVESAEVLPISRDYFRLRRPIDRRLYELARKHCGKQPSWKISASLLQKKIGSKQDDKHFMAHLRELAASNDLPDYQVKLQYDTVIFVRREPAAVPAYLSPAPLAATAPAAANVKAGAFSAASNELEQALASFGATLEGKRKIVISWMAMEQVPALAPGWDKHQLESLYCEWAADKDAAHNEDARFISWVKSFTKDKAL
jgi:plasmid replication initiation protein